MTPTWRLARPLARPPASSCRRQAPTERPTICARPLAGSIHRPCDRQMRPHGACGWFGRWLRAGRDERRPHAASALLCPSCYRPSRRRAASPKVSSVRSANTCPPPSQVPPAGGRLVQMRLVRAALSVTAPRPGSSQRFRRQKPMRSGSASCFQQPQVSTQQPHRWVTQLPGHNGWMPISFTGATRWRNRARG